MTKSPAPGEASPAWKSGASSDQFAPVRPAVAAEPMTETKGTYNSYSSLKLRPFPSGWVELRLVRVVRLAGLQLEDADARRLDDHHVH